MANNKKDKKLTGLVIARYQPPHLTHMEVFEFAKQLGIERLIVVKGSADKQRIPRHPFTPDECIDMLEMYLKRIGMKYEIYPVNDISKSVKLDNEELTEQDIKVYEQYAKKVIESVPPFDIVISGNPTIAIPFERLGYKVIKPNSEICCSSTYIRKEYSLRGDRCEDLLLPEQVEYMDMHKLYNIMKEVGEQEFKDAYEGVSRRS